MEREEGSTPTTVGVLAEHRRLDALDAEERKIKLPRENWLLAV